MISKIVQLLSLPIATLAFANAQALDVGDSLFDTQEFIVKEHKHGTLTLAVQSFGTVSAGANFTFQIVVNSPNGQVYTSPSLSTLSLPTPPFVLTTFNPIPEGTYYISTIINSITAPGSLTLSLQAANSHNSNVWFVDNTVSGTSDRLGQITNLGLFLFP